MDVPALLPLAPVAQPPAMLMLQAVDQHFWDHYFDSWLYGKATTHNRVRDVFYSILCRLHALTRLVSSASDFLWEPQNLSKLFLTRRLANMAIQLHPHHSSPYCPSPLHDVAINITITPTPETGMDKHQQKIVNVCVHMSKKLLK